MALDPASRRELEALPPVAQAAFERLCSFQDLSRPDAEVRIVFRFLRSPMEVLGADRVEGVRLRRNRLVGEPGHLRADSTADEEIIPCGLLLRSIGYQGLPLDGVPFDPKLGTIPNQEGRVNGLPRVYTTGWLAYGPRGVIGTARKHAAQVATHILNDLLHHA
jgi:ferredoxin--NADP+ reductase